MVWLWLGLKAMALARLCLALASKYPRPSHTLWLWPGLGLALAQAMALVDNFATVDTVEARTSQRKSKLFHALNQQSTRMHLLDKMRVLGASAGGGKQQVPQHQCSDSSKNGI
ncbi:hypothetical protein C8R46DRAFT_1027553 [Mycena filopes]|nr:hypothetical protein C8R46DRAFT_1027553 [Mycena filopes]